MEGISSPGWGVPLSRQVGALRMWRVLGPRRKGQRDGKTDKRQPSGVDALPHHQDGWGQPRPGHHRGTVPLGARQAAQPSEKKRIYGLCSILKYFRWLPGRIC